ncbi:hypothetical protein ACIP5N_06690 [Streptomyces sp. NPDC088768]|uniref:protein kinase domain-containing protein n=1 Tax=Streptomyces sp. NPDC088768 TaxID=3365894 RepID=UPI003804A4F3
MSDRRGSRAWKVRGPHGAAAVKANGPGGEGRDKAAETAQEDRHLLALTAAHAIGPGYRLGGGEWKEGRWLAVEWCDGALPWHAFAPARDRDGDTPARRALLLTVSRTWAAALGRLHTTGWTHADVQPTNALVTGTGRTTVIDYALACGPGPATALRPPYRGALVHTLAPEVAAALLATTDDHHVQAEPPSDIWGLGASLFWCWTGHRPFRYADDARFEDKLGRVATGGVLDLAAERPWAFHEFEEIITACLATDPALRPTAHALTTG